MPPSRRLVIADDSPEMRWFVRSAIGDEFTEVVEVADGRALFTELLRSNIQRGEPGDEQVVITDLYMPTYDGMTVLDAYQQLAMAGKTILITAFPSDSVRLRAEALGAVLLPKPFSTNALREVVRRLSHGPGDR